MPVQEPLVQEMVRLVKCSWHKHEDLSPLSRTDVKSQAQHHRSVILALGRGRQEDLWGSVGSQPNTYLVSSRRERGPVSKNKTGKAWKDSSAGSEEH